jgi:biopolymer transport protein ExbB/biopolymer transport protein TolQ
MLVERLSRIALLGSTWVLYLLLGLSVASLTAALERWVFFARRADDLDSLAARFSEALEVEDFDRARGVLRASRSIEASVVLAALRWVHGGPRALADAVDASMARARGKLLRSTYLLGTLGNNAPFVGLLGTVIGVIDAFHQLGAAGQNKGAMGNVMSGIAEALIATGVGLFVALPAVVAYNLVQKKVAEVETGVLVLGKLAGAYVESLDHAGEALPRGSRDVAPSTDAEPEDLRSLRADDEADGAHSLTTQESVHSLTIAATAAEGS